MATLTIRNLDENVKRDIRLAAAARGVSMEQEARDRLSKSLSQDAAGRRATAAQLIELGRKMSQGVPTDQRFKTLTQKEIFDMVSEGEL